MDHSLTRRYYKLLTRWLRHAETHFTDHPDLPRHGYYGTGYSSQGVMAHACFLAGISPFVQEMDEEIIPPERVQEIFLKGVRYWYGTHATGDISCTDGRKWGSGVSDYDDSSAPLFAECAMNGIQGNFDWLPREDRDAVLELVRHEADHQVRLPIRTSREPFTCRPESYAWRGALLARAALLMADGDAAPSYGEMARKMWMNAISVPADERDDSIVEGVPVRQWVEGANFHPTFVPEHNGFFDPGEITQTLTGLSTAYLTYIKQGAKSPGTLLYHFRDALRVLRVCTLEDGRLVFPAGEHLPRYLSGQVFMLPAMIVAQCEYGDNQDLRAEKRTLDRIGQEAFQSKTGAFAWDRLQKVYDLQETAYFQHESALPLVLSICYQLHEAGSNEVSEQDDLAQRNTYSLLVERSAGLVCHRTPARFASWAWRSFEGPAQGLHIPGGGEDLAEWNGNLLGAFHVKDHDNATVVLESQIHTFDGGFAALGELAENRAVWPISDFGVRHHVAFIALPDGRTSLHIDLAIALRNLSVRENRGLRLKFANDLFNDFERHVFHSSGELKINAHPDTCGLKQVDGPWLNLDGKLAVVGLYGSDGFTVLQNEDRTLPAKYPSIRVGEVFCPYWRDRRFRAHEIMRDAGTILFSTTHHRHSRFLHVKNKAHGLLIDSGEIRGIKLEDSNEDKYFVLANFSDVAYRVDGEQQLLGNWESLLGELSSEGGYVQGSVPAKSLAIMRARGAV